MTLRAVVPAHIARKWNAIALQQLCEAVPRLDEDIENERCLRKYAEETSDMWQRISEIYQDRGRVGLTMEGQIVAVPPADRREESQS